MLKENIMTKIFDVLATARYSATPSPGEVWYEVLTVESESNRTSTETAKRVLKTRMRSAKRNRRVLVLELVAVGPVGDFDQFIGKYQGQFIDEYLKVWNEIPF